MTSESGFKKRVRARMANTGEAYTTARQRLDASPRRPAGGPDAILHVTNGDSAAAGLHAARLGGEVVAWRDVLHEGPVPGGVRATELRRIRAAYLAGEGFGSALGLAAGLAARDRALRNHAGRPYVLWFEADLYDQLQLIQILQQLGSYRIDPGDVTLVSIGEHRGIAHFGGLGELQPEALARLLPEGVRLRAETLRQAAEAWAAFTAPEPSGLVSVARLVSPELRFLGEALARLLQEYPSRADGLSLTERRILLSLSPGPLTAAQVFREVWSRERRPYLGDTICFSIIRRLASARHPLLTLSADAMASFADTQVQLSGSGREVLSGDVDHVRLNGVDRWVGGVRLAGSAVTWRYDERLETLVTV